LLHKANKSAENGIMRNERQERIMKVFLLIALCMKKYSGKYTKADQWNPSAKRLSNINGNIRRSSMYLMDIRKSNVDLVFLRRSISPVNPLKAKYIMMKRAHDSF
jgi:hypothetical protein